MSKLSVDLAFRVFGPNYPAAFDFPLDFELKGADATIMSWSNGWTAIAQRTWTSAGWFPPF